MQHGLERLFELENHIIHESRPCVLSSLARRSRITHEGAADFIRQMSTHNGSLLWFGEWGIFVEEALATNEHVASSLQEDSSK